MRLLIVGIPGTGKTSLGNYLRRTESFVHHNFENAGPLRKLHNDRTAFLQRIASTPGDIVITWGFPVQPWSFEVIEDLQAIGFRLVWLDGDRAAALRAFKRRRTVPESPFHLQIDSIEKGRVVERLRAPVVDPFDGRGKFRPRDAIFDAIQSAAYGP